MANHRTRFFPNQGLVTFSNQGPAFELDPSVGATNGGFIVPCYPNNGETQFIQTSGLQNKIEFDVDLTGPITRANITQAGHEATGTMPAGTIKGQIKTVGMNGGFSGPTEGFLLTGSYFESPVQVPAEISAMTLGPVHL